MPGVGKIVHVEDARRALELLGMEHFHAVFYDDKVNRADERPFAGGGAARRSHAQSHAADLRVPGTRPPPRRGSGARLGVTDVLTMPISPKTLVTKLQVATHSPRPFIVATEFFGPDRRAKARPAYYGSDRRKRARQKGQGRISPRFDRR